MMFIRYDHTQTQQFVNMRNIFQGRTVILMGCAPSMANQPLHLLEQRGVLTAALNNAAIHFRPTLWFSADNPQSFEPQIIHDPTIMKFSATGYNAVEIADKPYHELPNLYFYFQDEKIETGEMFADNVATPWYKNTMFVALSVLVHMGVKRIILGGSDLGFTGEVYAHKTELSDEERRVNSSMYSSLVFDLHKIRDLLQQAGVEFMDCSANSKMGEHYPVISMEEAVALALEDFPKQMVPTRLLQHGTNFTGRKIKDKYKSIPNDNYDRPGVDNNGLEELT
jgi:hypothetical protein